MSEERRKIIDKAKKLKELADRGVGGEKENAKTMYEAYKKKHGLTDKDVEGHKYTEDFIKEFANMNDEQVLEVIGKSLLILGVGLLFSLINGNNSKGDKENKKRAKDLKNMFTEMVNRTKKKNQNNENNDEDIPNETEQKEVQKQIENILNNDKKNGTGKSK